MEQALDHGKTSKRFYGADTSFIPEAWCGGRRDRLESSFRATRPVCGLCFAVCSVRLPLHLSSNLSKVAEHGLSVLTDMVFSARLLTAQYCPEHRVAGLQALFVFISFSLFLPLRAKYMYSYSFTASSWNGPDPKYPSTHLVSNQPTFPLDLRFGTDVGLACSCCLSSCTHKRPRVKDRLAF